MANNDADHVAAAEAEITDVRSLVIQYARENDLTKRRLDQQDTKLKRRGRLGALAALVAIVALLAVGYFWRADVDARHAGEKRAAVVQHEVDQTLGIAHTFFCQQTPTPKGCPPAPPTTNNTQAIIDQVVNTVITRMEQIYPPPNGLR